MKTCEFTKVSISYFKGLNLTTTWESKVTVFVQDDEAYAWENIPMNDHKTMCCPLVLAAKVEQYLVCIVCSKKITLPLDKNTKKIVCLPCKRALPIKKCKLTTFCEITFEYASNQITLTPFNKILSSFFGDLELDQLEDTILKIDHVDVWFDNRRVIQKLQHHDDSQDA